MQLKLNKIVKNSNDVMIPGIGCRGRDSNPRSHGIPGKKSEHA